MQDGFEKDGDPHRKVQQKTIQQLRSEFSCGSANDHHVVVV